MVDRMCGFWLAKFESCVRLPWSCRRDQLAPSRPLAEPLLQDEVSCSAHCSRKVFILLSIVIGLGFEMLPSSRSQGEQHLMAQQPAIVMPWKYMQLARVQQFPHLVSARRFAQPLSMVVANAVSKDAATTKSDERRAPTDSPSVSSDARGVEAEQRHAGDQQTRPNQTAAFHIVPAETSQLTAIVNVVNWAYRGKHEVDTQAWTGERHLISGIRTTSESVATMIATSKRDDAREALFVAVPTTRETTYEDVLGTVNVKCIDSEAASTKAAEIGFFSVDPDLQGQGIGSALLRAAEHHAATHFGADTAVMWVISVRNDILEWYKRCGYALTEETAPFPPVSANVGTPRLEELHFVRLEKSLK